MLDWTDRHCRYFFRLLTKEAFLYTEMVTTGAVLKGNAARYLAFSDEEHPLALQLGGSSPKELADCARIAANFGYDEINLNVGCPSTRVQNGRFGACLMAEPSLVGDCVAAMRASTRLPVTVKTRIGIDDRDSYESLCDFIDTVAKAGVDLFIVHARKAWLQGLSPKENREIPPLCYDRVQALAEEFKTLHFILNGGIKTLSDAKAHLLHFAGVMLGRAVYYYPYMLSEVDNCLYHKDVIIPNAVDVLENYLPYVQQQMAEGVPLSILTKPLMGLFQGVPGARRWRRYLSEHIHHKTSDVDTLRKASAFLSA